MIAMNHVPLTGAAMVDILAIDHRVDDCVYIQPRVLYNARL